MIDIENELFTSLATFLENKYPAILVRGENVRSPAQFPCVFITEKDNYTYTKSQTDSFSENHANVVYEIEVFSNKASGKKGQCKAIIADIDKHMQEKGFTRTMLNTVSNIDDEAIYRMIARYTAIVSQNETIYRR